MSQSASQTESPAVASYKVCKINRPHGWDALCINLRPMCTANSENHALIAYYAIEQFTICDK